jgi:predicted MFS family arabinose efflux permease
MKTSAMMMFSASCGVGAFIGNISGGMLLEHITVFALFRLISIISVISLIFAFLLKKININFEAKLQKS